MAEPRASRPTSPRGYWRSRPLAWGWARQRLTEAHNYWIVSTRPDGVGHSRPVWGAWIDDRFYFDTGSRIGSHLLERPSVTVHLESADEVVIVEGEAQRITDAPTAQLFVDAYNAKYELKINEPPGVLFVVEPEVAYGWVSDPTGSDSGAIFGSTGTRWDFD